MGDSELELRELIKARQSYLRRTLAEKEEETRRLASQMGELLNQKCDMKDEIKRLDKELVMLDFIRFCNTPCYLY